MTDPQVQGLDELIATCADSTALNWVELYRDDLAAHGTAAVLALEPWLVDAWRGPRAVAVMVRAAKLHDAKPSALRALRAARVNPAAKANWAYIDDGLRLPGSPPSQTPPPDGPPLPAGVWVAPAVKVIHHVIEAHAEGLSVYGGDAYLFYCGRAFSGYWVRKNGGVLDAPGLAICDACRNRMAEGAR